MFFKIHQLSYFLWLSWICIESAMLFLQDISALWKALGLIKC